MADCPNRRCGVSQHILGSQAHINCGASGAGTDRQASAQESSALDTSALATILAPDDETGRLEPVRDGDEISSDLSNFQIVSDGHGDRIEFSANSPSADGTELVQRGRYVDNAEATLEALKPLMDDVSYHYISLKGKTVRHYLDLAEQHANWERFTSGSYSGSDITDEDDRMPVDLHYDGDAENIADTDRVSTSFAAFKAVNRPHQSDVISVEVLTEDRDAEVRHFASVDGEATLSNLHTILNSSGTHVVTGEDMKRYLEAAEGEHRYQDIVAFFRSRPSR